MHEYIPTYISTYIHTSTSHFQHSMHLSSPSSEHIYIYSVVYWYSVVLLATRVELVFKKLAQCSIAYCLRSQRSNTLRFSSNSLISTHSEALEWKLSQLCQHMSFWIRSINPHFICLHAARVSQSATWNLLWTWNHLSASAIWNLTAWTSHYAPLDRLSQHCPRVIHHLPAWSARFPQS